MHDSLHVVNSFWHGSELTEIGTMCINSFIKNGFTFRLWTYNKTIKVPKGCEVADASKILKKECLFKHKEDSWVPFSIWFRFKLLYEKGGAWTDMDIICLRPFKLKTNTLCGEKDDYSSINFLSLSKNHLLALEMSTIWNYPSLKRCYDDNERKVIKKRISVYKFHQQREIIAWKFSGNETLNLIKNYWNFNKMESHKIYPVKSKDFKSIFDGSLTLDDIKDSNCIHIWNEIIRRVNFDVNNHEENSIYDALKKKYLS
jgi:hypothetical protein